MSSSLNILQNLQSPEIKKISQHDLHVQQVVCSVRVIFGTECSINQVFNATILDCNYWMLDAESWDRGVWGWGTGNFLPPPPPFTHFFHLMPTSLAIFPPPNPPQLPNLR